MNVGCICKTLIYEKIYQIKSFSIYIQYDCGTFLCIYSEANNAKEQLQALGYKVKYADVKILSPVSAVAAAAGAVGGGGSNNNTKNKPQHDIGYVIFLYKIIRFLLNYI